MNAASLIAMLLVLAAAAVIMTYTYSPSIIYSLLGMPGKTFISGVSLEINDVKPVTCLGNVVQALPGLNATAGSQFNYTFNITDNCPGRKNITSILVLNPGFTVRSVDPAIPYEVFNSNRVPFTIAIKPPKGFRGGVLAIQVNVT